MKSIRVLRQIPSLLGLCCLLSFFAYSCNREPKPESPEPFLDPAEVEAASEVFRRIDVENRHVYEYSRFPTGVIRSQKAMDAFIEMEDPNLSDDNSRAFYTALRAEPIDFSREILFLFRHFRSDALDLVELDLTTLSTKSGKNQVRHLIFRLATAPRPNGIGNGSMAADCFPVIVDSSSVDLVSLEVDGGEVYSADLTKPTPPIVVAPKQYSKRKPQIQNHSNQDSH